MTDNGKSRDPWQLTLADSYQKYEAIKQSIVSADGRLAKEEMRLFAKLEPQARRSERVNLLHQRYDEAKEIISQSPDKDLVELAHMELAEIKGELEIHREKTEEEINAGHAPNTHGAIMEVRAGTGGDEAALFAASLWRMYQHYAELKGWVFETISYSASSLEGCRDGTASIKGKEIWERLMFESGVHRVQRVPQTETRGRIHTSTASVIFLPEVADIQVDVEDKDLRIETYRAQGAGGQHVNKTDSAVRITHIPTGVVAQCQDDKSQHRNRDRAMRVLKARIADRLQQEADTERSEKRKSLVQTSDRSERIRTYNYPQNRVSDHRTKQTWYKLDHILDASALEEILVQVMREMKIKLHALQEK